MRRSLFGLSLGLAFLLNLAASNASPPDLERYIIVLKDNVASPSATARQLSMQAGGRVGFVYENALKGFSIQVPPQALAGLQRNPNVKYVVDDDLREAFAQTIPTGIKRIFAGTNTNLYINGVDDRRVDVDVAVIDTGVDLQHPDLNVVGGVTCTNSIRSPSCVSGGNDDHYHGTHVAGIIGAIDNGVGVVGVAPGARIWAVKVLDQNAQGYSSWIIAGIDWVAANATRIKVANMSLGGSGYNQAEYDAIQGAVNKGVAFAVAAGNSNDNVMNYSPASFSNVITVSALADFNGLPGGGANSTCRPDQDDSSADFSNWGEVDIAAPGVCIMSTLPVGKGGYGTLSGTSMASPYVAGALALLASRSDPQNATDVYNLYNEVMRVGNFNWTDDSDDNVTEPLLDLSDTSIFAPVFVAANTAPAVTIASPAENASFRSTTKIKFNGTALDTEDGDLTSKLVWKSNLVGQIGTGGSFVKALSVGTHVITASVSDSKGLNASVSIAVVVTKK